MLEWIALIIFALLALAGIGLTLVGIGGTFLIMAGAALYDLITWSTAISPITLLWILALALAGEMLEWIITIISIKKGGCSRHALMGTVIGAIAGAMALSFLPIIGTIIGLFFGAIIGAFLFELYHTKNTTKAWKAAKAALLGRALVILTKFILAIAQIWLVIKEIL